MNYLNNAYEVLHIRVYYEGVKSKEILSLHHSFTPSRPHSITPYFCLKYN